MRNGMRICDRCFNQIQGEDKYCSQCGNYVGLKFCSNCGEPLNQNCNICTKCGKPQNTIQTGNHVSPKNIIEKECSHNVPLLIWSVILVILLNPIGMGFGIASIVYLFKARKCEIDKSIPFEETFDNIHSRIVKSRLLCILATIFDVVSFSFLLILIRSF